MTTEKELVDFVISLGEDVWVYEAVDVISKHGVTLECSMGYRVRSNRCAVRIEGLRQSYRLGRFYRKAKKKAKCCERGYMIRKILGRDDVD